MNIKLKFIIVLAVIFWFLFIIAIASSAIRIFHQPKTNELIIYQGKLVEYRCHSNSNNQSYFNAIIQMDGGDSKKIFVKGNCKSIMPNLDDEIFVTARLNPKNLEIWEVYFDDMPIVTNADSIRRLYIGLIFGGAILGGAAISFSIVALKIKRKLGRCGKF